MNFDNFKQLIDETDIGDLFDKVNDFEINDSEMNKWIDDIFDRSDELDINKMPYVLDTLYRSDDKLKFMSFCMLFEATFNNLPFITRLEDVQIYKAKYQMFIETLITVFDNAYDGIVDCLAAIVLNNDPKGELFTKEQYDTLANSINTKLSVLKKYITESKQDIPISVYETLEMVFDLATYIHNDDTIELLRRFDNVKLNGNARVFYIKALLVNNIMSIKSSWWEELFNDKQAYQTLARMLTGIEAENTIPKKNVDTEKLAEAVMIDWLSYPTELGKTPDTISLVGTIEKEDLIFYIYKFTSDKFADKGEMIGLSGAFVKDSITVSEAGFVFSKFETITDDYKKQAEDIIELIANHWKEKLEEIDKKA
ncbi:MAG: hypothetical protein IKE91_03015 [Clostridia bacterium]|nr:hypothetical protein [Clostridia bacterium]